MMSTTFVVIVVILAGIYLACGIAVASFYWIASYSFMVWAGQITFLQAFYLTIMTVIMWPAIVYTEWLK